MPSHAAAARLFLLGLALVGAGTAWAGVHPGDFVFLPCPSRLLAGVACPGCGMTRACLALVRGDLLLAWHHHPFSLALVPLAGVAALLPVAPARLQAWLRARLAPAAIVGLVLVAAWWMHRMGWT